MLLNDIMWKYTFDLGFVQGDHEPVSVNRLARGGSRPGACYGKLSRDGEVAVMLQRADVPLRPFQSDPSQDRAELEVSASERRLARELDKLLSEKSESDSSPKLAKKQPPSEVRSVQDLEDFQAATDDFEWAAIVSDGDDGVPLATDTAEAWLRKARRDQKRQKLRNFISWLVATVIGAVFIGCAAWLLAGWTPDVDRLMGFFSSLLS